MNSRFIQFREKPRSTGLRFILASLAALAVIIGMAVPAGATDAFPTTNDQSTTIATARWFYYGETASQVSALATHHDARITEIRVMNPSVPTFAVTMVANTGAYASGWWWYYGQTASQVTALLGANKARLISIDPYQTSAGLRFAVVMAPNSGDQARAWWWYYGITGTAVGQLLSQHNARLIALRPYMDDGQRVFAVIMISNTGADYASSEFWYGVPISTISSHVKSDDMRVIALAPDPAGGWDAILVTSEGEEWYWWYGISASTVGSDLVSHGTRLIDLSPYYVDGVLKFAAVEFEDNNPPQAPVNSTSQQIQSYADTHGWGGGYHGAYFVSSTPGAAPVVAANSKFRYEPASSIKVLYLLYTLRSGISMNSKITYYWPNSSPPNPDACPANVPQTPANAHTTTILTALTGMIQDSNNIYTRGFAIKWGLAKVQALANQLGMSSTHLDQPYIGCGFRGGVRNQLTLADAARLYASVSNGHALTGAARTRFFNILVGGTASASSPWGQIVAQQAASLGKSSVVGKFLSQLNVRWKAGSYEFCLSSSGCLPYKLDLALTGWISIPFVSGGKVVARTYEFGDFVNDLPETCSSCAASDDAFNLLEQAGAREAQTTIRQALATWK
jgi:hypothetical protein